VAFFLFALLLFLVLGTKPLLLLAFSSEATKACFARTRRSKKQLSPLAISLLQKSNAFVASKIKRLWR